MDLIIPNCTLCGNKHGGQTCATNPTTITWKYGGNHVFIYGSWSKFQVGTKMSKQNDYPFYYQTTLLLTVGHHSYKFLVNGVWTHDQEEKIVPDGFGGWNNQIFVVPKRQVQTESDEQDNDKTIEQPSFNQNTQNSVRVKIHTGLDGKYIQMCGSWDNWTVPITLQRRYLQFIDTYESYCYLQISPSTYEYKFIIDNKWVHDKTLPTIENSEGTFNNIIHVKRRAKINKKPIDIQTIYWSKYKLQNLKFERINGHSMTRIGNVFYIFGGCGMGNFSDKLYRMYTKNHQLEILENVYGQTPEQRAYHNAISYGCKILFFGGLNSQKVFNDYFVLNTNTLEWGYSMMTGSIPDRRERATMTLLNKEEILIYFGGYSCTPDLEVESVHNDVYCLSLRKMQWHHLNFSDIQPEPRYAHTATQVNDKMYVFGGTNNSYSFMRKDNFNDVWVFNCAQGKTNWVNITSDIRGTPPTPRHAHSAALIRKNICIFGGKGVNSKDVLNDIHFLDLINMCWVQPIVIGKTPIPRYYHAVEVFEDEMWLLGGNTGLQRTENVYIMTFTEREDVQSEPISSQSLQLTQFAEDESSSDDNKIVKFGEL